MELLGVSCDWLLGCLRGDQRARQSPDPKGFTGLPPPSVEITLCPKGPDCEEEAQNSEHADVVGKRRNWIIWDFEE